MSFWTEEILQKSQIMAVGPQFNKSWRNKNNKYIYSSFTKSSSNPMTLLAVVVIMLALTYMEHCWLKRASATSNFQKFTF